jgi:hypothetical protein
MNTLIAGPTSCGSASITVTDACPATVNAKIRCTTGEWDPYQDLYYKPEAGYYRCVRTPTPDGDPPDENDRYYMVFFIIDRAYELCSGDGGRTGWRDWSGSILLPNNPWGTNTSMPESCNYPLVYNQTFYCADSGGELKPHLSGIPGIVEKILEYRWIC